MAETIARTKNRTKPHKEASSQDTGFLDEPRPKNLFELVVKRPRQKTPSEDDPFREDLINFSRNLAEGAESGTLRSVAGVAEDADGSYVFGLEGRYLSHPEESILPLVRLLWRVMSQIESEDKSKDQ